jgi:plastocyanin
MPRLLARPDELMERMSMNAFRPLFGRSLRLGSVAALAVLTLLTPGLAAQDDEAEAHPAHIHSGTCDELGDVVVPLTDVAATDEATHEGAASAHGIKTSETIVDMPLQEILDGGHAINVHLSADEIDVYIACGDIGGAVTTDEGGRTELIIGLGELNDSGHHGVAWLGADGEQTEVVVVLVEPATMGQAGAEAAQEATPAAEEGAAETGADAAAGAVAVEIKDFAFNPPEITVPVGGSITWTNGDAAPHTATGLDREALQSGAIAPGESFTQAFESAGTIEYFCEFHPNMKGSIVVE